MLIKLNAKLYKYSNQLYTLILLVLIVEYLNYTSNYRRSRWKREIPLLEQANHILSIQCCHHHIFQEPKRDFMRDNVWISMSLCYAASVGSLNNHKASVSAAMSARMFIERSGMLKSTSISRLIIPFSRSKCRAADL